MPLNGYTAVREHAITAIKIMLNVDFREIEAHEVRYDRLIYTGPIDEFFDFRFGKLRTAHCGSGTRRSTGSSSSRWRS